MGRALSLGQPLQNEGAFYVCGVQRTPMPAHGGWWQGHLVAFFDGGFDVCFNMLYASCSMVSIAVWMGRGKVAYITL